MQCIRPIKANLDSEGNITFKHNQAMPGLIGFEFECRKCLSCRLNIAREKAVRSWHESKTHKNNIFLTLTYDEQNVPKKLQYLDFQLFMKKLRKHVIKGITDKDLQNELKISYMVTGEYGEKNKRPHWHAILFNFSPLDSTYKYTTDHGEKVYTSRILTEMWNKGAIEYGSVTIESAGYVARYAAKKLVHGRDQDHEYHPIHKTSSRRAIGRSWIEKYWKHTFENGFIVLPNGQQCKIPRYYSDWLKKHRPQDYARYATNLRPDIIKQAQEKKINEEKYFLKQLLDKPPEQPYPLKRSKIEETILQLKFKRLQERLKL